MKTSTLIFWLWGIAVLFSITGCSDMQFAGKRDLVPQQDPREDIVLTMVSTQMTSGGIVNQRVAGDHAVFSNSRDDLTIKDIRVTTFGDTQETQSITKADVGQVYFSARPKQGIGRKDMKFAGNVLYRNPQKNDPTTDSLRMTSELVLWNEKEKKFISPGGYEMMLLPKGQKPILQRGKSFEAAQDLTRFVVKAGSVTTDLNESNTQSREEMLAQFAVWDAAAKGEASRPITLPEKMPFDIPGAATSN